MEKTANQSDDRCVKSAQRSPRRLELRILSDPANLRDVRRTLESFATECGCDKRCSDDLGLCVNEALANIMRHAYHGASDQPIVIQATDAGSTIELSIRDWGDAFDPAALKRHRHDPLEPGGLGVICMRELMDNVTYARQQDRGMLLTLVRHKCG